MKFKNRNKTFIWRKGSESGEFKIDNHYNIISGKFNGKHYRDVFSDFDSLNQVYEFDAGSALLEVIK